MRIGNLQYIQLI